jgi:hypothetical protein
MGNRLNNLSLATRSETTKLYPEQQFHGVSNSAKLKRQDTKANQMPI